jgi:acetyltransferase-like isoleucine patch superfamily enzyme/glycosyltransferase involved in cell wall biosynthesis
MVQITVIIPVLNGMPYLREALTSLEAQTCRDFEVVLWDNGSTDGTVEEARQWIPSRLPGRVVTGNPLPLHLCLARMVEETKTELCARMDADDISLPRRFEWQMGYLDSHPDTVAVGGQMDMIDVKGVFVCRADFLPCSHTALLATLLFRCPLPHPGVMFRRSAVLKAGNYREPQPVEDLDLWLRLACVGKMVNLSESVLKYRLHSGSITDTAKKAGDHNRRIFECLCRNGRQLFSISSPTYGRLLKKKYPLAIRPLYLAARSIAQSSGVTTLQVLRSPEFLYSARCLTANRDVLSKIIYFLLGRDTSKSLFSQALGKVSFFPGVRHFLSWQKEGRQKASIRKWIAVQRTRGSSIESIDVRAEFLEESIEMGAGVVLEKEVSLAFVRDEKASPHLRIGDGVFIGRNTILSIHSPIIIGANVLIGAYSYITSCNHAFKTRSLPIGAQGYTYAPVTIEAGAWVGTHVVILPGIIVGEGAIVGAGSIVTRNIPPYEIWGGSPARFLGHRP